MIAWLIYTIIYAGRRRPRIHFDQPGLLEFMIAVDAFVTATCIFVLVPRLFDGD